MTMQDWETRLNGFIQMMEYGLLKDAGKVTAEIARLHALTEFENTASSRIACICRIMIGSYWSLRGKKTVANMNRKDSTRFISYEFFSIS